jgi:hypothetical protein
VDKIDPPLLGPVLFPMDCRFSPLVPPILSPSGAATIAYTKSFWVTPAKSDPKDRLYCRCGAALFRDDRCCLTFFVSCFVAWAACFAAFLSSSVIFIISLVRFYRSPSIRVPLPSLTGNSLGIIPVKGGQHKDRSEESGQLFPILIIPIMRIWLIQKQARFTPALQSSWTG